jgi:hypothetical protein
VLLLLPVLADKMLRWRRSSGAGGGAQAPFLGVTLAVAGIAVLPLAGCGSKTNAAKPTTTTSTQAETQRPSEPAPESTPKEEREEIKTKQEELQSEREDQHKEQEDNRENNKEELEGKQEELKEEQEDDRKKSEEETEELKQEQEEHK